MRDKNTSFEANGKRQISGKSFTLDISSPLVMGILNSTPDSFYDGGRYNREETWLIQAGLMIEEGVDIIDIGGMSTRPGAKPVSEKEELERVLAPLKLIKKDFPNAIVSIDTYRSKVARACVNEGADIINDISGGTFDKEMFKTIAALKVPYVLMHLKGTPETMQENPVKKNIVKIVKSFFEERVRLLTDLGVTEIMLDPGFGFGKSLECNYELLKNMEETRVNGLPILVGLSRKSMINKVLGTKPTEALNGTTAIHMLALQNGADILRVHDVKEAREAVKLFDFYQNSSC
jgi:dihydropteroate synthase